MADWKKLVDVIKSEKKHNVTIAIVGKYFATGNSQLRDTYYALLEAIDHASWHEKIGVNLKFINSEKEAGNIAAHLSDVDGIIVPIGWGSRGVPGKIEAIKYAREKKIPYLGLCYGLQLASIEYARNVVGLTDADTEENNPKAAHQIVHSIPFDPKYQTIKGTGTSMRLGTFDCVLKKGSHAFDIYKTYGGFSDAKKGVVKERHRHRFEFNNAYRTQLEEKGFVISGTSPDDFFVEMIELPKSVHPFFIATQGHPEYKSRPTSPHPLFMAFIKATSKK
jgi:CTP synthase